MPSETEPESPTLYLVEGHEDECCAVYDSRGYRWVGDDIWVKPVTIDYEAAYREIAVAWNKNTVTHQVMFDAAIAAVDAALQT